MILQWANLVVTASAVAILAVPLGLTGWVLKHHNRRAAQQEEEQIQIWCRDLATDIERWLGQQ